MRDQTIRINMRLPGLNEYTRACRSSRYAGATMKKDAERAVMAYVRAVSYTHLTLPTTSRV